MWHGLLHPKHLKLFRLRSVGILNPCHRSFRLAPLTRKLSSVSTASANPEKEESKDVSKETKEPKPALRGSDMRRVAKLARPEAKTIAGATAALLVSTAVTMSIPAAFGSIIDIATGANTSLTLDTLIPGLGGLFIVGGTSVFFRVYLFTLSGERVIARLRRKLFSSIVNQEIGFFDKNRTGELINRLSADTVVMGKSFTGLNLSSGLRSTCQCIGALSVMCYLSPRLTMVMLGVVPLGVGGAMLYGKVVKKLSEQVQDALGKATEVAEERIGNIRTVRSFAHENKELARYGVEVGNVFEISRQQGLVSGAFFGGFGIVGNMSLLAVLTYGAHLIQHEMITAGTLTSFLLYTVYVGMSSVQMSSFYGEIMRGAGASKRVFQLMDRIPEINTKGGIIPERIEGALRFEDISFKYPTRTDSDIFEHLSLNVDPGSVVAVVGSSGSGKSTMTSLLLRFYAPNSGKISLDNHNIEDLDPTWLRRQIGIVSQEPTLFAGTICDNIMYGLDDEQCQEMLDEADGGVPDRVVACAQEANAEAFITSFPDGYQTFVGEKGTSLSGGQKQRIAIARALLKNPKILLLDEATSALDAESELLVQEALERAMKNRTVIVIAHRLSTVQNADSIAVLEKGSVTEQGSHDELMRRPDSVYRQLMNIQTNVDTKPEIKE